MRLAGLPAVVAGCNWVYELGDTRAAPPIDAQYFDAPADAPPACPAPGVEPKFQPDYLQLPVPACESYIPGTAWGEAVARCVISQGQIDQEISAVTLSPMPANPIHLYPRVS